MYLKARGIGWKTAFYAILQKRFCAEIITHNVFQVEPLHHETEAKLVHPMSQILLRKREAQMQSPFAGVR